MDCFLIVAGNRLKSNASHHSASLSSKCSRRSFLLLSRAVPPGMDCMPMINAPVGILRTIKHIITSHGIFALKHNTIYCLSTEMYETQIYTLGM